jgi:hypothetical protein
MMVGLLLEEMVEVEEEKMEKYHPQQTNLKKKVEYPSTSRVC